MNLYAKSFLEKRFNRVYTSDWLSDGRVMKLNREADRAGGSVQLARIKNWRRPIVSIFFFATFDTRLNVIWFNQTIDVIATSSHKK